MAIRAKGYANRKGEQKLQVSMDQAEAKLLVKDDEKAYAEFVAALKAALQVK